jgi:O-antigen ligase
MATEVTVKRPVGTQVRLGQPLGLVLITLGAVALWVVNPFSPTAFALLVVVVLFLLGLRKPLWAMAAILIGQLTITSYMWNAPTGTAISLRLVLLVGLGLLLWYRSSACKVEFGPGFKRAMIPAVILVSVSLVSNLINSGGDFAFRDFRNMAVGLMIVAFIPAVVSNVKDLKLLSVVTLVGIAASAALGVFQYYNFMGAIDKTVIDGFMLRWQDGLRVPGMAETELELAYVVSAAIVVLLALHLAKRRSGATWELLLPVPLLGLALYFTYTRSAILAAILGMVALVIFLRTRLRWQYIVAASLVLVLLVAWTGLLEGNYLGGRSEGAQDESAFSRKIVWQAGLSIAVDNPILGIGGDQFAAVSAQYQGAVDPELIEWEASRYWGHRSLGNTAVHNDFLNVLVSYGVVALVAYVWLYMVVARNLFESYKSSRSRFIRGLALGLAAALVVYAVNAFYHNCFATIPLFWVLAGLSVAVAKLALRKPKNEAA